MRASQEFADHRTLLQTTALALVATALVAPAGAQVVTDGSVGPGVPLDLQGPDYQITDDLGTRAGDNLFHSFSDFSIDTGESATFSGPDEIANVISRVTGENPSGIDGTLSSTMPEADFYFINPNGVTFGPNAALDVQGSFHVSTADELRFEGGDVFSATNPDASGFAVAEPRAFGFYDAEPGAILVDGSTLEVGEGETLSLVGGDITVDGGEIETKAGAINLLALDDQGEADLVTGTIVGNGDGEIILRAEAQLQANGNGAGDIRLSGSIVHLDGESMVVSDNTGDIDSTSDISIVADDLELKGGAKIQAGTRASGRGADITVAANRIQMLSLGEILVSTIGSGSGGDIEISTDLLSIADFGGGRPSGVSSETLADNGGDAGDVSIEARSIDMRNQGSIRSISQGGGDSGDVMIDATFISSNYGFIGANTFASGDAGKVRIKADELYFVNEGRIFNGTNGSGDGGDIDIQADIIVADATVDHEAQFHTGIASTAEADSTGRSGDISVLSEEITLINGGRIAAGSQGPNDGGDIAITTSDLFLANRGLISAETFDSGKGGDLTINALSIYSNFGFIGASTSSSGDAGKVIVNADTITFINEGRIFNGTNGSGDGGDIEIRAQKISADATVDHVARFHTGIASTAEADSSGRSGDILIAAQDIELINGGEIASGTVASGNGGKIVIKANAIVLERGALISASTSGDGNAGDIFIDASSLEVLTGSDVEGSTQAGGNAGIIDLHIDDRLILDGKMTPNRTAIRSGANPGSTGQAGEIYIEAGSIEILNGSEIASLTTSSGDAGRVTIHANSILANQGGAERFTGITSQANSFSSGDAGFVEIHSNRIEVLNNAEISSSTFSVGDAGGVEVRAEHILIDDKGSTGLTGIYSQAQGGSEGDAGDIFIDVGRLELKDQGRISSSTLSRGSAGSVTVEAMHISVDGGGLDTTTGITSQAQSGSSGRAGNVIVTSDEIELRRGGTLSSSTFALRDAGRVTVSADRLMIDGQDSPRLTGIFSQANENSNGDAGNVDVNANYLTIKNDGRIASSTFASGSAGTVNISTDRFEIERGTVASEAFSEGKAGDVMIAANSVDLIDAEIRTQGQESEGGRIRIAGTSYLVIADSEVTSNGVLPSAGASTIRLNGKVITLNNSRVTSLTGDGTPITGSGVIDVNGDFTLISTDSTVEASSSVAISGLLDDFSNQLIVLDNQFADASRLLRESCESGGDLGGSTFITSGPSPTIAPGEDLLPGFYSGALVTDETQEESGEPVVLMVPCS